MSGNKKSWGFTLSELLMAIGVVGIIAAMTVPAVIENLHKRTFVAQLKSIVGEIQQLADGQMALKGTKDLTLTDFSSPTNLFSDKNFIVTKRCASANALADCWGITTSSSAYAPSKYRYINGGNYSPEAMNTIVLKNGVILSYALHNSDTKFPGTNDTSLGKFLVDVNGQDRPNVVGRDLFGFYVTKQGHIYPYFYNIYTNSNCLKATSNIAPYICAFVVINSNWQMDY